jgi:hydrogenase nickel incorporation protein HypA/HybF
MHELSIAVSIVDAATEEAERVGASRVEAVHLRLGVLAGVVERALQDCFELACRETPLEGSRLVIQSAPILIHCPRCAAARPVVSMQSFTCAICGTPGTKVVEGKELQIVALEVPS